MSIKLLLKTPKGLERIAASRVRELFEQAEVSVTPHGFKGLVLVELPSEEGHVRDIISREVLEAEKVLQVLAECKADLKDIAETASALARQHIGPEESFAVRTTRRGTHNFTSIDVNVRVGAAVQDAIGAPVNLTYPDKILWVEIIGGKAYISVTDGREEKKKTYPGKPNVRTLLGKICVAQMPYTGPLEAVKRIGIRIGRAAQTFELRELVIAPFKPIDAETLAAFIEGVLEGVKSRLEIQRRTYAHKVKEIDVVVQDMYQFVRDRRDEPLIVTSTRGRAISELTGEIFSLFATSRRVNVLIGAREGIPTGIFRAASLVIDVAPGITIPTDHALTAIVTAIINAVMAKKASF